MSGTNNIEPVTSEIKLFLREENTTAINSSGKGEQPVKKLASHDENKMETHESTQFRRAKFLDKYKDATYQSIYQSLEYRRSHRTTRGGSQQKLF
ncbi:hypothetical protein FRX31_008548 [Thalictrum thalictroides]|uniref:Uncharacterized protein n=1 Tax=Thalictrum thalictroides TaxID=46969 RepID=A0A7J6WZ58_THATH|nr:hypothetical protein FRX31_008548 [Thalictrum thalictroides]